MPTFTLPPGTFDIPINLDNHVTAESVGISSSEALRIQELYYNQAVANQNAFGNMNIYPTHATNSTNPYSNPVDYGISPVILERPISGNVSGDIQAWSGEQGVSEDVDDEYVGKQDVQFKWLKDARLYSFVLNNKEYVCSPDVWEKYTYGRSNHEMLILRSVFIKRAIKITIE